MFGQLTHKDPVHFELIATGPNGAVVNVYRDGSNDVVNPLDLVRQGLAIVSFCVSTDTGGYIEVFETATTGPGKRVTAGYVGANGGIAFGLGQSPRRLQEASQLRVTGSGNVVFTGTGFLYSV